MSRIKDLRDELANHNQLTRRLPNLSETDLDIREFIRKIYQLQIECEEFRDSLRKSFLFTETIRVTKIEGDLQIQTIKSVNNWEPTSKQMMAIIDEKEIKGTQYYEGKIKEIYENAAIGKPKEVFQ
jgi:hypothetical protein